MGLPYKSHPIYFLRRLIIIFDGIGIFLCVISFSPYSGEILTGSIICLMFSALFAAADLFFYATKKVEHPDEDPKWPTRRWIVGDIILAIILQLVFWAATSMLSWRYDYSNNVIAAYGVLADFICSVLHAWSFWKQVIARYRKNWLRDLPKEPCARCGYAEDGAETSEARPRPRQPPSNIFPYAGPSAAATASRSPQLTPESAASTMEEGLLIGSDFGTGYGSIEPSEPTLEQPEEVLVGKGKKKKTNTSGPSKAPVKQQQTTRNHESAED